MARTTWKASVRDFGEAVLDVTRAELTVLGQEWKRSGKHLGVGLGLCISAAMLAGFFLPTLLISAAVLFLTRWWEPWAAALWVAGALLLLIGLMVAVAYFFFLRRAENPMHSARRRLDEHLGWWRDEVLSEDSPTEGPANEEKRIPEGSSDDHED